MTSFLRHLLTLTLTSDDLKVIVVNVSLTLTNTTFWFVATLCFIVDVPSRPSLRMGPYVRPYVTYGRTYVRIYGGTDIFTGFIRSSLETVKRVLSAQQLYIKHIVHIQCLRQMQASPGEKNVGWTRMANAQSASV